jgi:hypothetical protein
MKNKLIYLAVISLSISVLWATPSEINYQGVLTDQQGNPVNGVRAMQIKLYDAPTGGNMTYQENIGNVTVADGIYSFKFGASGNGIASALNGNDHLALVVDSVEQPTRTKILAVPYALKAKESKDVQVLSGQIANISGNLTDLRGIVQGIQQQSGLDTKAFVKGLGQSTSLLPSVVYQAPQDGIVTVIVATRAGGCIVRAGATSPPAQARGQFSSFYTGSGTINVFVRAGEYYLIEVHNPGSYSNGEFIDVGTPFFVPFER